jgi:hypothetical protein
MLATGVDLPELRGDDDLVTNGGDRITHELHVGERAVNLRRVKESYAELHRLAYQPYRRVPLHRGAAVVAHTHAPEPKHRYP